MLSTECGTKKGADWKKKKDEQWKSKDNHYLKKNQILISRSAVNQDVSGTAFARSVARQTVRRGLVDGLCVGCASIVVTDYAVAQPFLHAGVIMFGTKLARCATNLYSLEKMDSETGTRSRYPNLQTSEPLFMTKDQTGAIHLSPHFSAPAKNPTPSWSLRRTLSACSSDRHGAIIYGFVAFCMGQHAKKIVTWPLRRDGVSTDLRFKAPVYVHNNSQHKKDMRFNAAKWSVGERKKLAPPSE